MFIFYHVVTLACELYVKRYHLTVLLYIDYCIGVPTLAGLMLYGEPMSILQCFNNMKLLHSMTRTPMAERCRLVMRVSFLLYLLTFSFSPFLRDFFSVICLIFLIPYYVLDYKNSSLALFTGKKYFLFLYVFLVLGIAFSQDVWASFITVSLHSFTSLTLPFVAMECVRSNKDLRHMAYAMMAGLFAQGLNGIYQYSTGYDFIYNLPPKSGRLTGSFSDYRVGNYIALTLIPALSLVWFWRPRYGAFAVPMALLCAAPAVFLMFFSYTRNAYITLFAALFFWMLLLRSFPWRFCLTACVGVVALLPWLQGRLSWEVISQDGRWDLWGLAVSIFKEYPYLGAGIGQYNAAFRELGLSPSKDAITISHPHNIYLQFMCENGLVGLFCALAFLLGIFYWAYKKLRILALQEQVQEQGQSKASSLPVAENSAALCWQVMAMYWCGWGAFLVSAFVGHNFFQRWWLALVMAYLGILLGALTQSLRVCPQQQVENAHLA